MIDARHASLTPRLTLTPISACPTLTLIMLKTESGARSRVLIWWGLAAFTLLAGYADLVRGGETLAPILLVIGYCVLVPLAILKS